MNILFYILYTRWIPRKIDKSSRLLFLVRASFLHTSRKLFERKKRKGKEKEIFGKIGHGKECALELFTNSCHFIENENMWINMKESYSVVKPFLTRFPRFFVTGSYHQRLHLSERWVTWKYVFEANRVPVAGNSGPRAGPSVALKRSHLVVLVSGQVDC